MNLLSTTLDSFKRSKSTDSLGNGKSTAVASFLPHSSSTVKSTRQLEMDDVYDSRTVKNDGLCTPLVLMSAETSGDTVPLTESMTFALSSQQGLEDAVKENILKKRATCPPSKLSCVAGSNTTADQDSIKKSTSTLSSPNRFHGTFSFRKSVGSSEQKKLSSSHSFMNIFLGGLSRSSSRLMSPTDYHDPNSSDSPRLNQSMSKLVCDSFSTDNAESPIQTPTFAREEKKISKTIEKMIQKDALELKKKDKLKIILVGPSDSGKSTILKQMHISLGSGFNKADRLSFIQVIVGNVLDSIKILIDTAEKLNFTIHPDNRKYVPMVKEYHVKEMYDRINKKIGKAIRILWTDKAIRAAFARSNKHHVQDTAPYFFENLERIADPDYLPSTKDILHCRKSTHGIVEAEFKLGDNELRVIDMCGQKSFRSAWARFFDDCKAIFFVASLAAYDQTVQDDPEVNRMQDALDAFKTVCDNALLHHVTVILLLTKLDLAEAKIKRSPVGRYFAEFHKVAKAESIKEAQHYFQKKFESLNTQPHRPIYTYFCTSTDTDMMAVVIDNILDVVVRMNLNALGAI